MTTICGGKQLEFQHWRRYWKEGQILTIIDLGEGTILLTPMISQVDKLADEIAKGFEKENITFDDLLQALHEIRKTYT